MMSPLGQFLILCCLYAIFHQLTPFVKWVWIRMIISITLSIVSLAGILWVIEAAKTAIGV